MESGNREFCCNEKCGCGCNCVCCTKNKVVFYKNATWWLWHAWWTRLVIIIIATIGYYTGTNGGEVVYVLFSLVAAVILIWAVLVLVNFCKYSQ